MRTAIGFVSVLVTALIADGAKANPLRHEPQAIPAYAGFAHINPNKNQFIIVGDTQGTSHWDFWRERTERKRKLTIDEITQREPAFVVHLGDLTTRGSSRKHWEQFDELHKEFRERKIPYFPILGNHEFYGSDEKALDYYFARFPHLERRRWYSFTWKNIAFILVDSNFSRLTMEENEEQRKWYIEELERFEKGEKINDVVVCCHEPPFTNSRVVRPNEKVKAFFADPFLNYTKTSFFFSGHSHSYERFQMEGKLFVVSGGGGGPRHKVFVNPSRRRYTDVFGGTEVRFFHFVCLQVQDNMIVYNVYRLEPDETFTADDLITISKTKQKSNMLIQTH